jgi:hypothetical protein
MALHATGVKRVACNGLHATGVKLIMASGLDIAAVHLFAGKTSICKSMAVPLRHR